MPEVQNYLRDVLFTGWTASQIASKQLTRSIPILFFRRQMLNLIKLAIFHCNEDAEKRIVGVDNVEDFAKVCLKMNDFLEPEEEGIMGIQEEEATKKQVSEFLIKNLLSSTHNDYKYMLPRYHKLFIELPSKLSKSHNYFDISEEFKKITGVQLSLYVAFGIITVMNLMRIRRDTISQDNIPVALDKKNYYSNVEGVREQVEIILKQVCLPIAEYKKELEKERDSLANAPKEYFEYSFLTIEKYPLGELENGLLLCLSLEFMIRRITENVYWILLDGLSEGAKRQFLTFMGEIFQEYMACILKRIYGDRFVQLHYGKSQNEAADGIAIYPHELVFFEAKTSRLLLKTRRSGDMGLFTEDVRNVIVKGSKQLDKVITDFKSRRFKVGEFGIDQIRRFYPVIATLAPFPQCNLLQEIYERMLVSEKLLKGHDIERLSLIDIEELEMLEPILGETDLLSILKQWHSMEELRDWSLKNFLYEKYQRSFPQNEYLISQFNEILDNCTALLMR